MQDISLNSGNMNKPEDMESNEIKIERTIAFYNMSDKLIIDEVNIDVIPLEKLLTIVTPKNDDPLLYDGYILSETQLNELNRLLPVKIIPDFKDYYYVLECAGLYD